MRRGGLASSSSETRLGRKEAGHRLLLEDSRQRRQVHVGVERVAAAKQLHTARNGTGLFGDRGQRKHGDEHTKGMRRRALAEGDRLEEVAGEQRR